MTGAQLKAAIYVMFGGADVANGYFSSTGTNNDVDLAIATAIDKVLLNMSPNADQGDYSTQSITTGDGATEAFTLASDFLRPLHFKVDGYEVNYVKSRDFINIVDQMSANGVEIADFIWYGTITGSQVRIYPYLTSSQTAKLYYIKRCDPTLADLDTEIAKVPLCYHEAVAAAAALFLGKKAKGQWPGDPMIFQQAYILAMADGNRLASEGFRDGIYPMQCPNWELDEL